MFVSLFLEVTAPQPCCVYITSPRDFVNYKFYTCDYHGIVNNTTSGFRFVFG